MEGVAADPPCHPQACAIQGNTGPVNEAKCRDQIIQLYKCCNALYTQKGEDAKTPSCPKPALLKVKMKQIENGDI
ncbi:hypothetical protein FQN49_007956 [Arthroderma sp. PD_2]|nr:hypothetical protein FQN49_007956 [Arthroderma sp. PD_2]